MTWKPRGFGSERRPLVIGDKQRPWHGGDIAPGVHCILAPNPSAWTLDGTNTWILSGPDSRGVIVIDPGPGDRVHRQAIIDYADLRGGVRQIVLTHGHADHSQGARELCEVTGAPVRALDPLMCSGQEGLVAGDVVHAAGVEVRVVATPGHSTDSLCFALPAQRMLVTGDTVLGRGTSVIAWPDGNLQAYLESLHVLAEVITALDVDALLPGHGPTLDDPGGVIDAYVRHRQDRLRQVRALWDQGVRDVDGVLAVVYANVAPGVLNAARMTVQAQLEYLQHH